MSHRRTSGNDGAKAIDDDEVHSAAGWVWSTYSCCIYVSHYIFNAVAVNEQSRKHRQTHTHKQRER